MKQPSTSKKPKVPTSMRMEPDIKAVGERRAKADRRSFAGYIEWLIEQDTQLRPPPLQAGEPQPLPKTTKGKP